ADFRLGGIGGDVPEQGHRLIAGRYPNTRCFFRESLRPQALHRPRVKHLDDYVSPVIGGIEFRRPRVRLRRFLRGFYWFDSKKILAVLVRAVAFDLWSSDGFTIAQIEPCNVAFHIFGLRKLAEEVTIVTKVTTLKITQ